jgi:hypothetical protein
MSGVPFCLEGGPLKHGFALSGPSVRLSPGLAMSFDDLFRKDRRVAEVGTRTCDLRSADDDVRKRRVVRPIPPFGHRKILWQLKNCGL